MHGQSRVQTTNDYMMKHSLGLLFELTSVNHLPAQLLSQSQCRLVHIIKTKASMSSVATQAVGALAVLNQVSRLPCLHSMYRTPYMVQCNEQDSLRILIGIHISTDTPAGTRRKFQLSNRLVGHSHHCCHRSHPTSLQGLLVGGGGHPSCQSR